MDNLPQDFLWSIGVNVTSNLVTDAIYRLFKNKNKINRQELEQTLEKVGIQSSKIKSVITYLANNGTINISGAVIIANYSIAYKSMPNSSISINSGTSSKTKSTSIEVNNGSIKLTGQASIVQEG